MIYLPLLLLSLQLSGDLQAGSPSPFATLGRPATWTRWPGGGVTGESGGSFLGGSDDCSAPHTVIPAGPQTDWPFATGTTGTTGQNEANCHTSGTSGIDNDVWFDWTATVTGVATLTTCFDLNPPTKIAVYPLTTCPTDGTSLACNNETCWQRSTVTWPTVAGATYTIQLGTQPGSGGGAGVLDITETFESAYQWDDGSVESQWTLPGGGELVWMMRFDTRDLGRDNDMIRQVGTGWGGWHPEAPSNGTPGWLYVWDDQDDDGDPRTGALLHLAEVETAVANVNANIVNFTTLPQPVRVSGFYFVGVSINVPNPDDSYPGPGDQNALYGAAWITGNENVDGFDPTDILGPGSVGVYEMVELAMPVLWLTRAIGDGNSQSLYCFGDDPAATCPCSNRPDALHVEGCTNSTGSGAQLAFSSPTPPAAVGSIAIASNLIPDQPALLFAGLQATGGGSGIPFGDGLRCVGTGIVRLSVRQASADGAAEWDGSEIVVSAGIQPGDTRYFQAWYRDPVGSPCGSGFNLSSAVRMEF